MPDPEHRLRPVADTVELFGCRLTIVDPDALLALARTGPVTLRLDGPFPAPVDQVQLTLTTTTAAGTPTCRLAATIRTTPAGRADNPLRWLAVGAAGPAGVLLVRRLAATGVPVGPLAARAGRVAAEASRRLGLDRPAPAVVAERPPVGDPAGVAVLRAAVELGLDPEITDEPAVGGGRLVTVRAETPAGAVTPAHVRALVTVVLQVVREIAGDDPEPRVLRGGTYVLARPTGPTPARPAPPSESVTLDQVGGLDEVVARFREIAISFRHPQVMARWGARRPQGILLYGPPGTGKTMLARALANEIGAEFREIRTPEILDKWLGGSERNIKQIFREARRYRGPTVLLFDEFDSIISYAGAGGDAASQAVNAVAGIFKQEMNTLIEENPNVIVVATTNFPQRVDASLIRSGRFDVKLSIPPPDEAGRGEIITKMIRELVDRHESTAFRMFADDVDPAGLAALSPGLTGADLREVLRRVQLAKAMREATGGAPVGPISQDDLREAIAGLRRG
ncbi:ATP-binding protein [Micromonospora sp. WMMD812]|uniref:ATP-binding protein n=1 Tax=Micromonospora sp. WMMD812 TaxID=3015152 RepID=UPI00248C35CC|nr:ATP-binding protein [Micromonospora sp. WMMD812]WBB69521.1 ATP-binding protein [Micromonospora sp. WMMD812]